MTSGYLKVKDNIPGVIDDNNNFYKISCILSKHCLGYWNFNMSINGVYSAYREMDKVEFINWNDSAIVCRLIK